MSARRSGKGRSLKRRVGTRPVLATFRVYTEGTATEPEYLDALKRLPAFRDAVSIAISVEESGATPMTLVEAARDAKRRNDSEIDQYWCVFDVENPDHHPYLDRALRMALDNDVRLAISNPCFELWLILHHRAQTAFLSTADAVRLLAELDGSGGKHLDAAFYMAKRADAVRRAESLRQRHRQNGTFFPEDNPSSSVDVLVARLEQAVRMALSGVSGRTGLGPE